MADCVYLSPPACWAPGVATPAEWAQWARGDRQLAQNAAAPALTFTDPLFRRRLGQLCKMTVQVVHDALAQTGCGDIPQVFVSLRGEVNRELTINRTLIEDSMVLPAAFSLSVFNAPIALATIACGLKSGYSVLFPAHGEFSIGFEAACAPVLCGDEERVLLVYGDELVPSEYGALRPEENEPFAFAAVLSARQDDVCTRRVQVHAARGMTPAGFLRAILMQGNA